MRVKAARAGCARLLLSAPSPHNEKETTMTMKWTRPVLITLTILTAAGCGAQGTTDEAEASLSAGGVPLYVMFLANNGRQDHFYTTSWTEVQSLQYSGYIGGYTPVGRCFQSQVAGTVPLYRLYSNALVDHFYTIDDNEANQAAQYGYVREGVACYVFHDNVAGACPFYRYLSDQGGQMTDHYYTESASDGSFWVQNEGYHYEGIAAYLSPYGTSCPR
jgi:Repeat of unknown function (DUF5648)